MNADTVQLSREHWSLLVKQAVYKKKHCEEEVKAYLHIVPVISQLSKQNNSSKKFLPYSEVVNDKIKWK